MPAVNNDLIYFVDDEEGIRNAVASALQKAGFKIECFSGAKQCLEKLNSLACNLLISDVKMPEMDGFMLMKLAKQTHPWIPFILVTGYGDIQMAVKAMKSGATDFIEKPFDHDALLSLINSVLKKDSFDNCNVTQPLTITEKKILKLILSGMSNKEIAHSLKRSTRTVEMHRGNIMHKFGVDNIVDLVKVSANLI